MGKVGRPTKKKRTINISISVDPDFLRKIRSAAKRNKQSVSAFFCEAAEKIIEK